MFIWFSQEVSLSGLLENWRSAGANYQPDQPVDPTWVVDGKAAALGETGDGTGFRKAVDRLFAYDVFPPHALRFTSDFARENRPPASGDRVVQRITFIPYLLDAAVMCIVSAVWHETDRRGFTIVTSEHHYGMGEWTATVTRKRGGQISFLIHTVFKPNSSMPRYIQGLARAAQLRAQRLAVKHFSRRAAG